MGALRTETAAAIAEQQIWDQFEICDPGLGQAASVANSLKQQAEKGGGRGRMEEREGGRDGVGRGLPFLSVQKVVPLLLCLLAPTLRTHLH